MKLIRLKYLLVTLFISLATIASAQTFGGGFFGGLAISQLDGDSHSGYNRAGVNIGAFTNTYLSSKSLVQLELSYIMKGSHSKSDDVTVYYASRMNYLQMELIYQYKLFEKFDLEAGLGIGYLTKSLEDKDGGGYLEPDPEFEKIEIPIVAGINYNIFTWMSFNARFHYSLIPVRDHPGGQSFLLNSGQYNNVITFTLYFEIGKFGKK